MCDRGKYTDLSFPHIGRLFDIHHTTVMSNCLTIEDLVNNNDNNVILDINNIIQMLEPDIHQPE